eukprot:ANDGO_02082.mRNA.1 AP-5 complex subunit mu
MLTAWCRKFSTVDLRSKRSSASWAQLPLASDVESHAIQVVKECSYDWKVCIFQCRGTAVCVLRETGGFLCATPELDDSGRDIGNRVAFDLDCLKEMEFKSAFLAMDVLGRHPLFASSPMVELVLQQFVVFVTTAMPFGDLIYDNEQLAYVLHDTVQLLPKGDSLKQPAWRPIAFKGNKPSICFGIQEVLRISKRLSRFSATCHSCVRCDTVLDGMPDISLSLQDSSVMEDISTHPCVQSVDLRGQAVSLYFCPVLWRFNLCQYRVKQSLVDEFLNLMTCDFRCSIRGSNKIGLDCVVRVSPPARIPSACTVEYMEVRFPFAASNKFSVVHSETKSGKVTLEPGLSWSVLSRTQLKRGEYSLSCVLSCVLSDMSDVEHIVADSFADVRMKITEFSVSQVKIGAFSIYPEFEVDPKSTCELLLSDCHFGNDLQS